MLLELSIKKAISAGVLHFSCPAIEQEREIQGR